MNPDDKLPWAEEIAAEGLAVERARVRQEYDQLTAWKLRTDLKDAGWPPALVTATDSEGRFAAGVVSISGAVEFTRATDVGGWVRLTLAEDDARDRGLGQVLDVRLESIQWVTELFEG